MNTTTATFPAALKAARRVSTPLIAIRTFDPAAAIEAVIGSIPNVDSTPILQWDVMQGLRHVNESGRRVGTQILNGQNPEAVGPQDLLLMAGRLPEDAVLTVANLHRFWSDPAVMQGIWNLRDSFKANGRALIMLIAPGSRLPEELVQDLIILEQPLPTQTDLERIVQDTFQSAEMDPPSEAILQRAVDAVIGLAGFPAEQVLAMSLTKAGLDFDQLWERKRQVIAQTPGLSVWRGGESFADIGGCLNIKRFLQAVLNGADPPRVIVFVDEIEKAFAGTGTDLSGVKTEMAGTLLTWMQDREAEGTIFLGPPGAAKSAVGKATGNTAGVPTIAFDLSAMQDSLVGASGGRLRAALQVVDAVSQGRSLWIATCNSIASLAPELRRRFTLGTFFFDLPSSDEREAIWKLYLAKYDVAGDLPDDEGWTGAEIKECCRKAARLGISLRDAADYIVPVSRSASEQIRALRQQASGKFISASKPGTYEYSETTTAVSNRRVFRQTG